MGLTVCSFEPANAVLFWQVQAISMEVGRVGNNCLAFWAYHCCSVVVVPTGQGQAAPTVETFMEASGEVVDI